MRSIVTRTRPHVLGLDEALGHVDHVVRQTSRAGLADVNCYVITGGTGTGKSRTLEAARAAAIDTQIPAACTAALLSDLELPLRTLFRVLHHHCFSDLAEDSLARIRWVDVAAGERLDMLEHIRDLLVDSAVMTPMVVMIDDFHLADRSTASAVHHLVSELRGRPVLWLLAGRLPSPADDGPDNFAMFNDLPVARLNLRPLDPSEIERIYGDRIRQLPAGLVRWIREECDGNAYLIETLIRLSRSGEQISADPGEEIHVPDRIAATVAARWLAGLSPTTRTLVEDASVFHGHIDPSLLAELAGQSPIGTARSIEEAVAAGVLTGSKSRLRFRSRLVNESIRQSLSEFRRRSLTEAVSPPDPSSPGLGARPDGARTAGLTEAELKVVGLVVTGMTNKAVARELRLSPHTVDTHLRHAFGKLGVRSRTALTREILLRNKHP